MRAVDIALNVLVAVREVIASGVSFDTEGSGPLRSHREACITTGDVITLRLRCYFWCMVTRGKNH